MSKPAAPEVLFGRIAVSCGFVSEAQIESAVAAQRNSAGKSRHLGRILIEQGVLTEDEMLTVLAIQRENRVQTEVSPAVKRIGMNLGTLAVTKGFCSVEDVQACITEQAKLERFNLFFRLGEVMVSRNILAPEQVHELLAEQDITILGCPGCFSRFNVIHFNPEVELPCPRCGTVLEKPTSTTSIKVDDEIGERQPGQSGDDPVPPELPAAAAE